MRRVEECGKGSVGEMKSGCESVIGKGTRRKSVGEMRVAVTDRGKGMREGSVGEMRVAVGVGEINE